jgi:hypothetical protein
MLNLSASKILQGQILALQTEVSAVLDGVSLDMDLRYVRIWQPATLNSFIALLARATERHTGLLQGLTNTFAENPSAPIVYPVIPTQQAGEDVYQGLERVLAGVQTLLGNIAALASEIAAQIVVLGG